MNDIATTYAPAYARRPTALIDRHAESLAELRQFHDDHARLEQRCREQESYIARMTAYNALLREQLETAKEYERIAMTKLMRLATHVSTISKLSCEATEIVNDVKEWEDQQNSESVARAVAEPQTETNVEQQPETSETEAPVMADEISGLTPTWLQNRS